MIPHIEQIIRGLGRVVVVVLMVCASPVWFPIAWLHWLGRDKSLDAPDLGW